MQKDELAKPGNLAKIEGKFLHNKPPPLATALADEKTRTARLQRLVFLILNCYLRVCTRAVHKETELFK
jgi:hypothetical protein